MIRQKTLTHVRFEPHVDGGTTYAFSYEVDRLVTGRHNMYRLINRVAQGDLDLPGLLGALVDPQHEHGYGDPQALLRDLFKLTEAGVIETDRPAVAGA